MDEHPPEQTHLVPPFDTAHLPPLAPPGTFVSAHANLLATTLALTTGHEAHRGTLSRLRRVAALFDYDDPYDLPWQNFRHLHLRAVITHLDIELNKSEAMLRSTLTAVRKICHTAYAEGLLPPEEWARLYAVKLTGLQGAKASKPRRPVPPIQLTALIDACNRDPSIKGVRDACVLGLVFGSGLSRQEVVGLDVPDLNLEASRISVGGPRPRTTFLDPGTRSALTDWLDVRVGEGGPLFLSILKNGQINYANGRLSGQSIYNLTRARARDADIPDCSPSDLRFAFARALLEKHDLSTAQRVLGHASPRTTDRYRDGEPELPLHIDGIESNYVRRSS